MDKTCGFPLVPTCPYTHSHTFIPWRNIHTNTHIQIHAYKYIFKDAGSYIFYAFLLVQRALFLEKECSLAMNAMLPIEV